MTKIFAQRHANTLPVYDVTRQPFPLCFGFPNRSEDTYILIHGNNPPVANSSKRQVNFEAPYCIAFTVSIPNDEPAFIFNIVRLFQQRSQGSLQISRTSISYKLGDAMFEQSLLGISTGHGFFFHLQLCVDDGAITLYRNCSEVANGPLTTRETLGDDSVITFFQNSSDIDDGVFTV